jgi:hypothetical protein
MRRQWWRGRRFRQVRRFSPGQRDERGDVPGWVMITVMTIVMASALLMMFQGAVTDFLQETLDEYM